MECGERVDSSVSVVRLCETTARATPGVLCEPPSPVGSLGRARDFRTSQMCRLGLICELDRSVVASGATVEVFVPPTTPLLPSVMVITRRVEVDLSTPAKHRVNYCPHVTCLRAQGMHLPLAEAVDQVSLPALLPGLKLLVICLITL
ncbi:hypothetical protein J6590_091117 [Homalodisca vitripennis]|nr:hypothetical protein J6590_091117 [Homalodisca vitripennis]